MKLLMCLQRSTSLQCHTKYLMGDTKKLLLACLILRTQFAVSWEDILSELSSQYCVLLMTCRTRQESSVHRCLELMRIQKSVRSSCFHRTTSLSQASTSSRLNQSTSEQETHCRSLSNLLLRLPPTHRRPLPGQ